SPTRTVGRARKSRLAHRTNGVEETRRRSMTGLHRTAVTGVSLALTLAAVAAGRAADDAAKGGGSRPVAVIDLWPGAAPGDREAKSVGEEQAKKNPQGVVTSLTNVTKPTLSVYRPEGDANAGVAVVVCPGGGYNNLAWDHEGEQV